MKFAGRLLRQVSVSGSGAGWSLDAETWIYRATSWTDEALEHLGPCPNPVRVVMDAPGRRATRVSVYDRNLLLVTMERPPLAARDDGFFWRSVRVEWRARIAGDRRHLATSLMMHVGGNPSIHDTHGATHIGYSYDHERPGKTFVYPEWPPKTAVLFQRIERAHEPREAIIDISPTAARWGEVIAPTISLQFVP